MQTVAEVMDVPLVPYDVWFRRLETSVHVENPQQISRYGDNSAVRLLDFFRQGIRGGMESRSATESMGLLPRVSVEKGKLVSPTLANPRLAQLCSEDVKSWIEYWRHIDFLP